MEKVITKNDKNWNLLFSQLDILNVIESNGYFEITAEQIKNSGREPRLMTKFDSKENLPTIFKNNELSILPISRSSYIIGHFANYENIVIDNNIKVDTKYLPRFITTIDYKNISSEAISLNSAYISMMIEDLVGEKVVPTVQGRMGTGEFNYEINLINRNEEQIKINVKNTEML